METLAYSLLAAVLALYGPPLLVRSVQLRRLRANVRGHLVLTYDDGPDDEFTAELGRELAALGAPATFYVMGERARGREACLDDLVRSGHEVCAHGDTHQNDWKKPWTGPREIRSAWTHLAPWLAPGSSYRPPYGKLATPGLLTLLRRGSMPTWWTQVSGDTFATLPEIDEVVGDFRAAGGGVVLLHCHHRRPERRAFVLDVSLALIDAARTSGMTVCTYRALADERQR